MSVNLTAESGDSVYNFKEFVIDSASDISNLPTNCAPGSTAFCIETSILYMMNSQKQWKEVK